MHPRAEGLDRFVLFAILGIAIVSVGCGGSADSSLPRAPDASSAASVDASASPVDASDAEARSDADAGGIGDSSVDARVDSGSIDGSNASPDAMACSPGIDAGGDCGPSEPAPCDSTHCPAGCCDANGTCQSGGSPAACGAGGAACQTCPAGSECFDCPAGTDCETARFCGCGPESCPSGCCTGGGRGVRGNLPIGKSGHRMRQWRRALRRLHVRLRSGLPKQRHPVQHAGRYLFGAAVRLPCADRVFLRMRRCSRPLPSRRLGHAVRDLRERLHGLYGLRRRMRQSAVLRPGGRRRMQ